MEYGSLPFINLKFQSWSNLGCTGGHKTSSVSSVESSAPIFRVISSPRPYLSSASSNAKSFKYLSGSQQRFLNLKLLGRSLSKSLKIGFWSNVVKVSLWPSIFSSVKDGSS